jgi:hypothetical protein
LAFFAFFFVAFFAFLAIVILIGVNGETRHEGCSAEGQPRNILDGKLSRFAQLCPASSHPCHRVIHRSDAFSGDFAARIRIKRRLTMPESVSAIHQSKTKARVGAIAVRLH